MEDDFTPYDPFSVCFNLLKLKYRDYDESLTAKNFLTPEDKVNVFINLETVYKYLSMILDLDKKILVQKDFDVIMESNILNLASHYKRFFKGNGLDTRVYLYNTDLKSEEFIQYKYNEDFRSYYLTKFNSNPKFSLLTEHLTQKILPDIKIYCEFIPDVYYISAKNIEGSLVPYIIAKNDESRKNLIIGGELYDTQYSLIPNFVNHYIHRSYTAKSIYSDVKGYLKELTSNEKDCDLTQLSNIFSKNSIYCSLMSVLGDKVRSIDKIYGIGIKTFQKKLEEAMMQNIINENTTNPEIIGDIFKDGEVKDEFINNFYCSSVLFMYHDLTESEKKSILSQQVDRIDINSLRHLNDTTFYNHKIILEGLLI